MLHCTCRYDAVQFGLFNLLLHILCHSCAKLNLGVADVYGCSRVTLSEILHAPIHDELNNSHKRKGMARTHNHAECFNMVMRSCHAFPFVGIVEFIMYGCMKYFRERYMAASINISNPKFSFAQE